MPIYNWLLLQYYTIIIVIILILLDDTQYYDQTVHGLRSVRAVISDSVVIVIVCNAPTYLPLSLQY